MQSKPLTPRHPRTSPGFFRTTGARALGLALLAGALSLAGCRWEHLASTGADDVFIRQPGETPTPVPMKNGPLLPLTPGARWDYSVVTTNQAEKSAVPKNSREAMVVSGQKTVGKATGMAIAISQNGKPFREEVYHQDSGALTLVAAGINNPKGGTETMAITSSEDNAAPGIPLAQFPVKEGAIARWEGILRLMKNNIAAPGTAYSRVSGTETVKVPAGTFGAYRIDTMINTTVQGQQIYLYTTRWLAPGVGLVKQRVVAGAQLVMKELTGFRLDGGGGKPVAATLNR